MTYTSRHLAHDPVPARLHNVGDFRGARVPTRGPRHA